MGLWFWIFGLCSVFRLKQPDLRFAETDKYPRSKAKSAFVIGKRGCASSHLPRNRTMVEATKARVAPVSSAMLYGRGVFIYRRNLPGRTVSLVRTLAPFAPPR